LKIEIKIYSAKWSGRWHSNPQPPAWESKFSLLYFHNLQNHSGNINVHATHTVRAMPDLRIAAGRFAGRFLLCEKRARIVPDHINFRVPPFRVQKDLS
jgi:hypothetical protein